MQLTMNPNYAHALLLFTRGATAHERQHTSAPYVTTVQTAVTMLAGDVGGGCQSLGGAAPGSK
jgi:hypothetical protein